MSLALSLMRPPCAMHTPIIITVPLNFTSARLSQEVRYIVQGDEVASHSTVKSDNRNLPLVASRGRRRMQLRWPGL